LEKEVPHSFSVTSLTFLVEIPSTYISISANTSAFSQCLLVSLLTREEPGGERTFALLGDEQVQRAYPRPP
jgi:hypothetical protein